MRHIARDRSPAGPRAAVAGCHTDTVNDRSGGAGHVDEEQLTLHFLGELDYDRSDAVHRHIGSCPTCGARAEEIIEVMAALAFGAEPDDLPR